ncbi:MAG TPA: rhodanese-related sulfurtransferase [Parachlamydiaceae bacterium]|nr:rhodanese-related sulfurtransferase [Parachlamydiaceae bacterium]
MTEKNSPYLVLAYYQIAPIKDAQKEVLTHKDFFKGRDITSRIYISEDGINGQMCASYQDAEDYITWMSAREEFKEMAFKLTPHHEQAFPRLVVKYRKQLVAFTRKLNLEKRGVHVSPAEWKRMLQEKNEKIVIDVRNQYEWKVGRFEGANLPPCETFRDFDKYAEELKEKVDPKKTAVMMYCTGGIRCEFYSAALMEHGFEKVYQLEGGVINYGNEEGSKHWLGKLFVFDDRLVVPISNEKTEVIGTCHHCKTAFEAYYNCANMECNQLFICCKDCLETYLGCCCTECKNAKRVRPYHHQNHKPFLRLHHYREKI